MSFRIGSTLDSEKAFLVHLSETAGRLDPSFHRPYFQRRRIELESSTFAVISLGGLKGRIFQGVGRNLVEGAPTCLLKVKNITPDGEIDFTDTEPVAEVPKSKILQSGDIISPFIGAAIKGYKFARFAGAEQPCAVDNNTGVIRITDDRISSEYLHAFSQTGLVRWQLDQLTGGGGVPFLGSEYAGRIRLPLPSAEVQKTVVSKMRDAKRKKNEAEDRASALLRGIDDVLLDELGIPRKLEPPNTLESRIFRRDFTAVSGKRIDPAANWRRLSFDGRKFPLRRLRDVASINPVTRFPKLDPGTPVSFVPMDAVSDVFGEIADRQTRPIEEAGSYTPFQNGDVIWAKITPCMENGKAAVAEGLVEGVGYGSTEFHVFRRRSADLSPHFLHHLLRLKTVREHARRNFTGSSGHQRVDEDFFYRMEIPFPPPKVQERIAEKAEATKTKARKLFADARTDLEKAKRDIEALILGKEAAE